MYKNLENYLKEVSRYLISDTSEDILMEIRANVLERAEGYGDLNDETINRALTALGSPRVLAANYGDGKEIIAPVLRNYLFLYTSVLFAIHLGSLIITSVIGTSIVMFPPLLYAPNLGLVEILLFLPFAFIYDFGLVSLVLFAVSQWAPHLSLPFPAVSKLKYKEPSVWTLLTQLAGVAGFAAMWHYHSQLTSLIFPVGDVTIGVPAQIVFLPPLIVMAVAAVTTAFHMLTRSRLVPVLGSLVALVGLWFIAAMVDNPAIFQGVGELWDVLNRYGFRGLLLLMTLLATVDLGKNLVLLMSVFPWKREVVFRPAASRDWINTLARLAIYIFLIVSGAIIILPYYPVVWFVLVLAGLLILVRWHNNSFGFKCSKCGNEFEISTFLNFISPHGLGLGKEGKYGWKWLRCPQCKRFSAAKVLKKE